MITKRRYNRNSSNRYSMKGGGKRMKSIGNWFGKQKKDAGTYMTRNKNLQASYKQNLKLGKDVGFSKRADLTELAKNRRVYKRSWYNPKRWAGYKKGKRSIGKARSIVRKEKMAELRKAAKSGDVEAQKKLKAIAVGDIKMGKSRMFGRSKYQRQAMKDYEKSTTAYMKSKKGQEEIYKKAGLDPETATKAQKKLALDAAKTKQSARLAEMSAARKGKRTYRRYRALLDKQPGGLSATEQKLLTKYQRGRFQSATSLKAASKSKEQGVMALAESQALKKQMKSQKSIFRKNKMENEMIKRQKQLERDIGSGKLSNEQIQKKLNQVKADKALAEQYQASKKLSADIKRNSRFRRLSSKSGKMERQKLKELKEQRATALAAKNSDKAAARLRKNTTQVEGDMKLYKDLKKQSSDLKKGSRVLRFRRSQAKRDMIARQKEAREKLRTGNLKAEDARKQMKTDKEIIDQHKEIEKMRGFKFRRNKLEKAQKKQLDDMKAKSRERMKSGKYDNAARTDKESLKSFKADKQQYADNKAKIKEMDKKYKSGEINNTTYLKERAALKGDKQNLRDKYKPAETPAATTPVAQGTTPVAQGTTPPRPTKNITNTPAIAEA